MTQVLLRYLQNEEMVSQFKKVIEDGKLLCDEEIKKRRKIAKKQGHDSFEEDDPDVYKQLLRVTTLKLFADLERRRKELEIREVNERKRQRELEIEEEEKCKKQKAWEEEWDAHRGERVSNWRDFQKSSKNKKSGIKPPKVQTENRN